MLVLVAMLASMGACGSCRRTEERLWAVCSCDYMTDMDYPGKVRIEVCGEPTRQKDVAKSCALTAGVGAVLECVCQTASGAPCRDDDTCRDVGR